MGAVVSFDLTARTYRSARFFARNLALAGDRAGADALLCRLLWLVEAKDGGFIGLTDCQMAAKIAADPVLRLIPREQIAAAQYAPGGWPSAGAMQVAA